MEIKIKFKHEYYYIKENNLFMIGHVIRWFYFSSRSPLRVMFSRCAKRYN